MQRSNLLFMLGIIFVILVAGCIGGAPSSTTTTANVTANVTTSSTTTTTIPGPEVLSEKVSKFLVDADSIYYLTDSEPAKIFKQTKNSKTPAEFATGIGSGVNNIGSDSTYLYLTQSSSLGTKLSRIAKADGKAEDVYSCAPGTLANVFTDNSYIYIFPHSGTFCRIAKSNLVSDGNFRGVVTDAGQNIAFGSSNIFYADSTWIKKVPISGKFEVSVLITDTAQSNVLIDGSTIYYVTKNNDMYKIGIDGKGKSLLSAGISAKFIAQDTSFIYFIDNNAKSISKIAKGGGAPMSVQKLTGEAADIVVDDTNIYWIEGGSLKTLKK